MLPAFFTIPIFAPFLCRPADSPNEITANHVMAGQAGCPDHADRGISRAGQHADQSSHPVAEHLLQLMLQQSILKAHESTIFILQTVIQAGPSRSATALRDGHSMIGGHLPRPQTFGQLASDVRILG